MENGTENCLKIKQDDRPRRTLGDRQRKIKLQKTIRANEENNEKRGTITNSDNTNKQLDENSNNVEKKMEKVEYKRYWNVGKVQCFLQYIDDENTVLIDLRGFDVHWKPTTSIIGTPWSNEHEVRVDLVSNNLSQKKTRRFSEIKEADHGTRLIPNRPIAMSLKNKDKGSCHIRLTLFDSMKVTPSLALGRAFVSLQSLVEKNTVEIDTAFVQRDEPEKTILGRIKGELTWEKEDQYLYVKLDKIAATQNNTAKEYFIRATLYIGNIAYCVQKTSAVISGSHVKFYERISFHLPSRDSVRSTSIVLQYMEKNMFSMKILGQAVIGPYMQPTNGPLSCWEDAIINAGTLVHFDEALI